MKVLFVSSGNIKRFGISPIVSNQGKSLENEGVEVTYFGIRGKGLLNYLKNIKKIRQLCRDSDFDVIHSHYSLSSFIAVLARTKIPIVSSLMGSDLKSKGLYQFFISLANRFFWIRTIVKAEAMLEKQQLKNTIILPNGVDFELFRPMDRRVAREKIGFSQSKFYAVFIANPARPEKNVQLARNAMELVSKKMDAELSIVFGTDGIDHHMIPHYLNAADLLILTSLYEGSPNVIKEAMACNCPIVATDVGDVKSVIGNTKGCYVTSYSAEQIAEKILLAGAVSKTNGRSAIQHLDSKVIAQKLIKVYAEIIE